MNLKTTMYWIIIVLGVANVFLQAWLLMLDDGGGQPLWLGTGIWFILWGRLPCAENVIPPKYRYLYISHHCTEGVQNA